MESDGRGREWRTAIEYASRWFGLAGSPLLKPTRFAGALIVLGAVLMATAGQGVAGYLGGGLWLIGAAIAVLAWFRLVRTRAKAG
jgi:hypothetical protein